jgi:hypothetical protein
MRRLNAVLAAVALSACTPTLELRDGEDGPNPKSLALKGMATTYCEILQTGRWERLPEVFEKELADQLIAGRERAEVLLGATTSCRPGRALYLGGSRSFAEVLRASASERLDVWRGGDGRARDVILRDGRSLKAALATAP